jgi:nitrous oxidase accessory protein
VARGNVISHANGATGMALGFKESSNILIEDNEIIYSAIGVGSDHLALRAECQHPNSCAIALRTMASPSFNSELGGNVVADNVFEGNLTQVGYGAHSEAAAKNFWQGNYWDDYQGFDRDGDGIGDRPHELLSYADQIWMEMPVARFFRNSPVMELLDFLERLAPFSTPAKVLQDDKPRFSRERVSS